jgi:hypothetical protein
MYLLLIQSITLICWQGSDAFPDGALFWNSCWTLMCRGASSTIIHPGNLRWVGDHFVTGLHSHKGDSGGEGTGSDLKACYVNVLKPWCCIGLALIVSILRGNMRRAGSDDDAHYSFFLDDDPEKVYRCHYMQYRILHAVVDIAYNSVYCKHYRLLHATLSSACNTKDSFFVTCTT